MKIAEMGWREAEEYLRGDDRAVLPIGSTEQHCGLSLATDAILAERVAVEAAEPLGVPVFPVVAYGVTPYFMAFPGTVTLRPETYLRVLTEILESMVAHGFRRIVVVNGHGGNSFAQQPVVSALAGRHSLSLLGAPPQPPPVGRLPRAAPGSAEWADWPASLPGDGMGLGRKPHCCTPAGAVQGRYSASISPPQSRLGRRRVRQAQPGVAGGPAPAASRGPALPACVKWHNWWNAPATWARVMAADAVAGHASWLENFAWTRVAGTRDPGERKAALDMSRMRMLPPARVREEIGDGNLGGVYQMPDEVMEDIWKTGVEETRQVIEEGWTQ